MELRRICFDYLQEAGLFVGWLGRLCSCLKLHKLSKLIWPGRYLCSSARKRCRKSRKEARRGWEHLILRIRPLVLVLLTGVQGDEDVLVHLGGGELCQVDFVPGHLDPGQQRQVILCACSGLPPTLLYGNRCCRPCPRGPRPIGGSSFRCWGQSPCLLRATEVWLLSKTRQEEHIKSEPLLGHRRSPLLGKCSWRSHLASWSWSWRAQGGVLQAASRHRDQLFPGSSTLSRSSHPCHS